MDWPKTSIIDNCAVVVILDDKNRIHSLNNKITHVWIEKLVYGLTLQAAQSLLSYIICLLWRELWDEAIIFHHSDFNDYVQKNWILFLSSKITKTVVKSDGLHIHQKEKNKYYINSSFIFQTLEKKEEKTTLFLWIWGQIINNSLKMCRSTTI